MMGMHEFRKAEELNCYDKHVIVDARDNKCYESTKHHSLQAMAEVLDKHFTIEARADQKFHDRARFDMETAHIMSQFNGMSMFAMGDVPDGYFDEDTIPDDYLTVGPLYMFKGCICSKNFNASVIATRDMYRELEKERDLTPQEERIATEFHTHVLSMSGHEPDHSHVE